METKHLHWNSHTGNAYAWIVRNGEIIKVTGMPGMTREEVEELAEAEGAELAII